MKKMLAVPFALLMAFALAAPVMAGPGGPRDGYGGYHGGDRGYDHPAIPPEKMAAFKNIMKDFRDKTQPIREQLWTKRTELKALSRNPNTQPSSITKLAEDMSALRTQLYKERQALDDKLEKEVGINIYHYGADFGGYGAMGGRGWHDGRDGRGWHDGRGFGGGCACY